MREFERVQIESRAELRIWLQANHPEARDFEGEKR